MFSVLSDPTLVMPWFVTQLGAGPVIVGLLVPMVNGGWFLPQLWVSTRVQRLARKLPVYRATAVQRVICWALLVLSVFLFADRPQLLLRAFLLLYAAFWVLSGIGGLAFMDVVAKAIPADRRGSFFGWRDFIGGVLALASSGLVAQMLAERHSWAIRASFGRLFAMAGLPLAGGLYAFCQLTEPAEAVTDRGAAPPVPLKAMPRLLRQDRSLALLVGARAAQLAAAAAMPFYAVYAKDKLGAPSAMAGIYTGAFTLALLASTLMWGRLTDRRGNRLVMLLSCLLSLPAPLVPLLIGAQLSYAAFTLVFLLLGAAQSGSDITAVTFILDLAPPGQRAVYVGLLHTVLGGTSLLLAGGGFLARQWGLNALFALCAGCALLSALLVRAVREPRVGKG